ncbi:MAG TPA: ABC transporter ATP-binding protein [Spirochaetota bacterium]|nr:ABC transporter ATP-binding protein [Spirochaetota bacterium]HPV41572.1 ABC transporter ATP-binding protein [Spirochaetota bacterium]
MIDISNLSLTINGSAILKDISLTMNDGEIVGLIGKSGSGKTLLLKSIAGRIRSYGGTVTIQDTAAQGNRRGKLMSVSYYGSALPQNPEESLYNFLLLARVAYKKPFRPFSDYDRQVTEEYLSALDLGRYCDARISTLPDGIFRLAMLAHTLIGERHAVIFDNPTNDLDILSVRLFRNVLARYVMNGSRVAVVSSNDLNFISQTADRIVILKDGCIVETGTADIMTADTIKRHFGIDVLISRNIYNGKPEIHLFPDA